MGQPILSPGKKLIGQFFPLWKELTSQFFPTQSVFPPILLFLEIAGQVIHVSFVVMLFY